MILLKILGNMILGVLLASIFGTIMFENILSFNLAQKMGGGIATGLAAPFFLPNYAAYHYMGTGKAVFISGFAGLLFYFPFLMWWWIRVDEDVA